MSDKPGDDKYLEIIRGQGKDMQQYIEIIKAQEIQISNYKCELENLKEIIGKFHEQYKWVEEKYASFCR